MQKFKTTSSFKMDIKGRYKKTDYTERLGFYEPPTTSCQDMIGLRTNDTSTDTGYPSKIYDFVKKLGDGSASTIHMGKNKSTEEKVIIKKISKREEWKKELSVLKNFEDSTSGRILKYIDYFESQRNSYIVTEFYTGFDLFEHIDLNVPYTEDMSYKLLSEMAKCVKECHDKNIVHLDIKCENFMVKKDKLFSEGNVDSGNVVLIDFGHAEKITDKSIDDIRIGYNYGTTFYLCPEGYEKVYSSKSDIWSLGICLSLLATGDYPFYGDEKEFMLNAVHGNMALSKSVGNRTSIILHTCLDSDPRKRPTIDQLISMLKPAR